MEWRYFLNLFMEQPSYICNIDFILVLIIVLLPFLLKE